MERLNIPIHISKIRPLDDFILQTDRFKLPDFNDLPKVNRRMTANLLYYQTNYFISLIIIFTLLALCSPTKFLIGLLSLVSSTAFFLYLKRNKPAVEAFQANHPAFTILGIFLLGYLAVYLMDSVAVFLMATLFPVLLILIHSALRQRNLVNKINEKAETMGIKKTPMGMALDFLGQELDKIE